MIFCVQSCWVLSWCHIVKSTSNTTWSVAHHQRMLNSHSIMCYVLQILSHAWINRPILPRILFAAAMFIPQKSFVIYTPLTFIQPLNTRFVGISMNWAFREMLFNKLKWEQDWPNFACQKSVCMIFSLTLVVVVSWNHFDIFCVESKM